MVSRCVSQFRLLFIFSCVIGVLFLTVNIKSSDSSNLFQILSTCNFTSLHCQQWSEWTNCSSSCGGGFRDRTRQCPLFENGVCLVNTSLDSSICNTQPCPVWSAWSQWSSCTITCNSSAPGYRTRTRACPVSDGCGAESAFQMDPNPCTSNVTCPQWSDWSRWSDCSRSCGRGDRTRRRRCHFSSSEDSCLGNSAQVEPCSNAPCSLNFSWSGWSPCTVSCGGGVKTRTKLTCAEGPPTCPLQNDQATCNRQACPQWTQWREWLACSRTCGGGQRIRRRTCPIEWGCVGKSMQLDRVRCNNFDCPPARKNAQPSSTIRTPI